MSVERDRELRRRKNRRCKLRKLRARLAETRDPQERERLLNKMYRISPWLRYQEQR